MKPLALIIDDEPDIRELLGITLHRMNVDTCVAATYQEAIDQLSHQHFDLCLADMRLPDGNGIDIVRHVNAHYPDTPIAMITAHGNMDCAIQTLKAGAFDFVSKPVDLNVLRKLVETALQLKNTATPTTQQTEDSAKEQLLGQSVAIEKIRKMIDKLARSQAPVFITGESGTGKELAAKLIHQKGPRQNKSFVPVNCGAIPQELMESEFFGHIKGSFTGASKDKEGLFQAADNGTLFLDEVADLPLDMQVKLLRAIQEKAIRPVGAAKEIPVDVRLISASHKDVKAMVEEGSFRQDLFYRIHVIELLMPALRDRHEDITTIVDYLVNKAGHSDFKLSADALQLLKKHPFPGNVRELENILERAFVLCDENIIEPFHLGLEASNTTSAAYPPTETALSNDDHPIQEGVDLETHLSNVEKEIIEKALEDTRWNRTAAAKKLGITFRALRYRLQKLGLDQD